MNYERLACHNGVSQPLKNVNCLVLRIMMLKFVIDSMKLQQDLFAAVHWQPEFFINQSLGGNRRQVAGVEQR